MLLALSGTVSDTLANVDKVSSGLETGPIRWVAAFFIIISMGLFAMLMRVQKLRVDEFKANAAAAKEDLKASEARSEKLGAILEKHNAGLSILDRTVAAFVSAMPREKRPRPPPEAPP